MLRTAVCWVILSTLVGATVFVVGIRYSHVHAEVPIEPQDGRNSPERVGQMVAAACKEDYAIVFVQLNWTFLHRERDRFQEFARQYRKSHPRPYVNFHIIDFTPVSDGYKPLAELPGWDEHDPGPNCHQINGVGEIIWLNRGQIVGLGRLDAIHTVDELIDRTNKYFPAVRPDQRVAAEP